MRYKRVVVAHHGGPEVIIAIEEELPTPKAGEVRVKVLAAGVSLPDVLAREGVHPETPRVPYTPGWDLVGTVRRLNPKLGSVRLPKFDLQPIGENVQKGQMSSPKILKENTRQMRRVQSAEQDSRMSRIE